MFRFESWCGVLAVAVLLLVSIGASEASACSVCQAGDPRFDANGTSAQQVGSFSAYLELRGWKKKSGLLPDEGIGSEVNESQRLDLFLSYSPLDRLTLTLDLPFRFNEVTEGTGADSETARVNAFGDLSLTATGVVWRDRDILPSTWVEARVLLKLPSGPSHTSRNGLKDPHLQAGTGSWDTGLGIAAVHKLDWGALYSSLFYRINTEGSLDYEYGDVVLANLAVDVPVGHAVGVSALDWLTLSLQLNYRWADKDRVEGLNFQDSGGSILYVSPGASVALPWFEGRQSPLLRVSTQVPLTSSWLEGRQHEDPVWAVGILYRF